MATKAKGAGAKKHGRNTDKCAKYRNEHRREKNKLSRIVRSNGYAYATAYATQHQVVGWFIRTYPNPEAS